MELGLSERWVLLADVTRSTRLFWELTQAGAEKPKALFDASCIYSGNMESLFVAMEGLAMEELETHLGNTMGDGFILVGRNGHGDTHVREDATRVLSLARSVKNQSDSFLAQVRQTISTTLKKHDAHRDLPELTMKIALHHGYMVTMRSSQRLFGDTINFCSRVAGKAFEGWNEGIVLTQKFFNVLSMDLQKASQAHGKDLKLNYPKGVQRVYRIPFSDAAFWDKVESSL